MNIEIPKIKLYKEIYPKNSTLNNVDKNVEIIKESNINNNFIILASHSGTNPNAYFNNISNLNLEDKIYINYNNIKSLYKINKIYFIKKTGYLKLNNKRQNKLILITCSLERKNKQLIIEASYINKI